MDNSRLFLFAALAFVGMLLWQQWQADYGPQPLPVEQTASQQNSQSGTQTIPQIDDLPDQAENTATTISNADGTVSQAESSTPSQSITIETDVIIAKDRYPRRCCAFCKAEKISSVAGKTRRVARNCT